MRIIFLIGVLLAINARSAFAIKPATQDEISAIEAQLLVAKGMDERRPSKRSSRARSDPSRRSSPRPSSPPLFPN